MMRRMAPILLVLASGPVSGQEDMVIDQSKLYVSDPRGCDALVEHGMDAFLELDFLTLNFQNGIQATDFQCNFYDVKSRPNTPRLFASAVCTFPGELYPDIFAIAPNGPDSILVVSGAETTLGLAKSNEPPSDFPVGTTLYHRCDNLSEIPID